MSARPPRLLRALMARLVPAEDRRFVMEDLDDTFVGVALASGRGAARRWYAGQLLRSLPLLAHAARDLTPGRAGGELRTSLRLFRRRPHYAIGVAGTLGLGLAAAVILGGIAWRVWLQPLPFPDSEQLVRVYELGRPDARGKRDRGRISPPLLRDLRERRWTHLTDFGAISISTPEWTVEGEVRPLRGSAVTPGFFDLLGITPSPGRTGWASRTGAEVPEVVLAEDFWRRAFGGAPSAVGSRIELDGVSHTVIGVVPQAGGYPAPVDLFTPLVYDERQLGEGMRGARYLEGIARVRAESSIEAAGAEFAAFIESLGDAHPIHAGWTGEVVSLREDLAGPFRAVLRLLLAAGSAFLILAIVNVTGLVATRGIELRHEQGIRLALGASRARLVRGAWVEGTVLGGAGGGLALAVALVLLPLSIGWLPDDLARSGQVGLSAGGALAWWLGAVVAGGMVGVLGHRTAPASPELRSGTRTTRGGRTGAVLVAGQLALSTLLIGIGSLVLERSVELADHDVGFESEGVWSAFVDLPRTTHEDWEARRDSWSALLAGLEEGGVSAAVTTNPPMSGMNANYGYAKPGDAQESFGQYSIVSPDYFDVMGIPVVAGRTFEPGESGPVTLISQALAEAHFAGEDPVGRTLRILAEDLRIIGVVGSTAHFGPDTPVPPQIYVSYEAVNWDFAHLVARGDPSVAGRLADAVERWVPGAVRPEVFPYERYLSDWFRPLRIQLGIVGALGLVGALLAGLGLYANIAYQVRERLPELGIRVALGASRARIVGGVIRYGMTAAGVGLGVGMVAWWGARDRVGHILGSGDATLSPFALMTTAVLILGLALCAIAGPAILASRAEPLDTLRSE